MHQPIDENTIDAISFIGNTLGPLFLYEPFSEENAALYKALSESNAEELASEWPFIDSTQAEPAIAQIIDGIVNDKDDTLLWEYRRLFVGPALKAAAPWGSVYTDKDQVIFGESTLELRKWMRENGVAKLVPEGEPEDHIGLMMLMMSWLAQNKSDALPSFLQDHLLTWAPHFLDVVQEATTASFFTGLASLTKASLQGIGDALELEVTEPRFYR